MREYFDNELNELNEELLKMTSYVYRMLSLASSLIGKHIEVLDEVKSLYEKIDSKQRLIEASCMKLLLLRQPVASDLRQISSILKIITDLQRIGDQAENIAEMLSIANKTCVSENKLVSEMALVTSSMLSDAIKSFKEKDKNLAKEVIKKDDLVDENFILVKNDLIDIIHKDKNDGEFIIDILMCAKYYEKIGDHCVNIAKQAIYYLTGKHPL